MEAYFYYMCRPEFRLELTRGTKYFNELGG
jgi:hypothetical protein